MSLSVLKRCVLCSFFKFCHDSLHPSDSSPRPEDLLLSRPPPGPRSSSPSSSISPSTTTAPGASGGEEDIELISDYSWRNFFSTINFVHILQKLTKRKTHRVLLMVQYKSSVSLKVLPPSSVIWLTGGSCVVLTGDSQANSQGFTSYSTTVRTEGH